MVVVVVEESQLRLQNQIPLINLQSLISCLSSLSVLLLFPSSMSLPFAGGRLPSGVTQLISKLCGTFHLNGGGAFWDDDSPSWNGFLAFAVTALAGVVLAAAVYNTRGRLKSPWSRRKRKHVLSLQTWRSMFTLDGKLKDGGIEFLKKVRSGGIDPSIRPEVWPFLLGIYELSSSKEERDVIKTEKRREYEKLRRQCRQILKGEDGGNNNSPDSEDVVSARESLSSVGTNQHDDCPEQASAVMLDEDANLKQTADATVVYDTDSIDSDSSEDPDVSQTFPSTESRDGNDTNFLSSEDSTSSKTEVQSKTHKSEDFSTWQRIIRLDAVRANAEWISYSPSQAAVEEDRAHRCAKAVGLKDFGHLEPSRIFHAARLVAILEAYALYDPEIGYCQGMSDLLSPLIAVMTEDYEAFWCFVGFMKKARHNFRLDEVGIRRQLKIVSKIIKYKDSHLYRHLEKLQAEDCFFVYRMVVVLFRRELTFEQTLCLWEVIWADQAAIRAGLGKSACSKIRLRIPPTEDLLLYAIAASVLQRRKLIIEKYNSMDEILRECNSMAGHLDVWKLLDDAHNLVVSLHDKI